MVISHEASKYVNGYTIGRPFYGQRLSWKPSILQFVDFVATLSSAKPDEVISCFSVWLRPVVNEKKQGLSLNWSELEIHAEKKLTCNMWRMWRWKSHDGFRGGIADSHDHGMTWYDFGAQFAVFTHIGMGRSSKPYVDLIILVAHHPVWTHTQLLIHSHTVIHVGRLMQTLPSPPT